MLSIWKNAQTEMYRLEKAKAICFRARGTPLPRGAIGVCAGCDGLLFGEPDAHHLIVPKNHGVRIDYWWNLVPLHQYMCHPQAHTKEGRDAIIRKLYRRLVARIPGVTNGHQWIQDRIQELIERGEINSTDTITLPDTE
jgi:hypothetical protein